MTEIDPERTEFNHLTYPPFIWNYNKGGDRQHGFRWGDLRLDGLHQGPAGDLEIVLRATESTASSR